MTLEEVADELYGLPPREFTAARDAHARRARASGDADLARAIRALRRPTLSAWAGNLLVRRAPQGARELLRLGDELRDAHRALDGERLHELGRKGNEATTALTRTAARLAAEEGQEVGESAQRELSGTLRAVLADPEQARQWRAGRLTRPLDAATGFDAAVGSLGLAGPSAAERPSDPEHASESGGAQVRDLAVERERRRGVSRSGGRRPVPREPRTPDEGRDEAGSRRGGALRAVRRDGPGGAGTSQARQAAEADHRARREVEEARRQAEEADRGLAAAHDAARAAADRESRARAEVEERATALREARQERDRARTEARRTRERVRAAEREARGARDAVRRAERAAEDTGSGAPPG